MNANGTTTTSPSSTSSSSQPRRPLRKRSSSNIGGNHRGGDLPSSQPIAASRPFLVLVALLGFALAIQFVIVFSWHHGRHDVHVLGKLEERGGGEEAVGLDEDMRQQQQQQQYDLQQQQQHQQHQQQQQLRQKSARDNDVQNEILTGDEMQNHGLDGEPNSNSNSNFNSNNLNSNNLNSNNSNSNQFQANYDAHHGYAYDPARPDNLPPLPPFLNLQSILTHHAAHAEQLVHDTLSGSRPTVTGIALVLQNFLSALHESNRALAARPPPHRAQRDDVHSAFVSLARQHLQPLEDAYRGRSVFPIRDDDSIFISLASFRDHLLGDTLKGAFDQAKRPDRLFVGAVVQNCFGLHPYPGEDGVQCRTGAQVVGKDEHGHDTTKVSDAPPDRNGIDEFCASPAHRRFCDSGQIRVLYLHENESLGPAMARYYASKLWAGETHFVQVDSHLEFYTHWDDLYVSELRSAKSFPKAILSSYPPGFGKPNDGKFPSDHSPTPGARLCTCEFSTSDVEAQIIRINTGIGYKGTDDEDHPTQIPFIAAGFFFAPAEFLIDVPFDPYMPWCFMGEEIMLSMRAWTHGWDIYAPRWNWIMHQYRPGRMGLPKFWGSVGRLFGRPGPGFSNQLQLKLIKRVKYLVGYEDCCTRERLVEEGSEEVLEEVEHYGFGEVRTREQYLEWANIDVKNKRCQRIEWCNRGELE